MSDSQLLFTLVVLIAGWAFGWLSVSGWLVGSGMSAGAAHVLGAVLGLPALLGAFCIAMTPGMLAEPLSLGLLLAFGLSLLAPYVLIRIRAAQRKAAGLVGTPQGGQPAVIPSRAELLQNMRARLDEHNKAVAGWTRGLGPSEKKKADRARRAAAAEAAERRKPAISATPSLPGMFAFEYADHHGVLSSRTVYLTEAGHARGNLYLTGICQDHHAERTFRVDRIIGDMHHAESGRVVRARELASSHNPRSIDVSPSSFR